MMSLYRERAYVGECVQIALRGLLQKLKVSLTKTGQDAEWKFIPENFYRLVIIFYAGYKYSLILSTFKCCHKKGKVDETRRYNFRLFQVFFVSFLFFYYFFFFIFSPVLLPKAKYNRKKNISRRLLISALTIKLD